MRRRQSKNARGWSVSVQITGLMLTLVLLSLSVVGPVTAQHRTFTVTQLTPVRTIAAAKKDLAQPTKATPRVQTGPVKGTAKGTMKTAVTSAVCDVTIAAGASPVAYLALSGLGVLPVAGVSDDSVTDFDVLPYTFAGETYTRIGFSSNGYAIVGGTTDSSDNSLINQSFPDPTRPNNTLAPFWTDLNPESGGNLYTATVNDGSDSWIVLDWEAVPEFSSANQNSFEIWIGLNGDAHPAEDISYAYGVMQGSGNDGFLTVGAENKSGAHGQNYYFNGAGTLPVTGTQLRVTTTSCVVNNPFSTAGSTGTIDEDSLSSASVLNFVLGFNPGTTGTITSRYNITPTRGISQFCPATSSHIALRFRDSDGTGPGGQVILTIHQTSIATGGNNVIYTFDSNVSAQDAGSAFQTYATDVPIDFDFGTNVYWIEAQLIRSNANVLVHIGSIQIFESDGTACP